MTVSTGVRKFMLAAHIAASVGWVGAAVAYIALDVTAATSRDPQLLRVAYVGMDLIVRAVIVPLAVGSLLTGLAVSLGTKWGLFRHWWVVISLLLTVLATAILLMETQTIGALAAAAADPTTPPEHLLALGNTLAHSVGGTAVLLLVLVLNVYKPPGLTRYGWRKQQQERDTTRGDRNRPRAVAAP